MTESQAIRTIFETEGYTILIQEKLRLDKLIGRKYATVLKVQWKNGKLPHSAKMKLLKAFGYRLDREAEYRLIGL
jgi:hypothetical protein